MRVLVTGATGFVGRWLVRELEANGHEAVPSPGSRELDITDEAAVAELVAAVGPGAIAHLAGISFAGDAAEDPAGALSVNEGGTRAVLMAAASQAQQVAVLVSGSADVYGAPKGGDLPLNEEAPLRATQPYGRSKLAQERIALEIGAEHGLSVVVTRSFNHTGPGQRPEFVAPALAQRVINAKRGGRRAVPVGNLDVRRDIGDVRDVVRAYRLLLEGLADRSVPPGTTVNVATGEARSIRELLDMLGRIVGTEVDPQPDPGLQRKDDPPLVVGDSTRLRRLTGWAPEIPIHTTLEDLVASLDLR